MCMVHPGEVGISAISRIVDMSNYKVWEVALSTLHPDVLTVRDQAVYLKAGVRSTKVDRSNQGVVTIITLGLGERWHVIADSGRDTLRIVAYTVPPSYSPVIVWSPPVLQYGDTVLPQQRSAL